MRTIRKWLIICIFVVSTLVMFALDKEFWLKSTIGVLERLDEPGAQSGPTTNDVRLMDNKDKQKMIASAIVFLALIFLIFFLNW